MCKISALGEKENPLCDNNYVNQNYELLQHNSLNTEYIVQKMNACDTLSTKIYDPVNKRLGANPDKMTLKAEVEKQSAIYCKLLRCFSFPQRKY